MRVVDVAICLLAGLGAALLAGVVLIELLDPFIWPSAIVAVPAGAVVGVVAAAMTYVYLTGLRSGLAGRPDAESPET